ncbi:MAG TPA: phosphatidylinositol-specific phospholipase C domain-containing protein [Vicinamibacterales bacterium]|nr:phosphatidylinositol-specific phospholipase C domain-containing protein [Vicinamibacterales bacterium]
MKIVNNYDFQGFLTKSVFWRTFGAWDDTRAAGLVNGLLEHGKSTDYDRSVFFQIEFKKANAIGEFLVKPGPIYTSFCGDVTLDASGSSLSVATPPWNLPKTPFTEWMGDAAVQKKTLHQITIPCTHDSGAYRLGPRLYTDSTSSDLPKEVAAAFAVAKSLLPGEAIDGVENLIRSICQAQSAGIDEQLNDGIRSFDLRVVTINDHLNTGHGMVGEPIFHIARKVMQFLEHTKGELVILRLGIGSTTDDAHKKALAALLKDTFGDRLVQTNVDLMTTPIGDLTRGRSRVIVTGGPGFRNPDDLGPDEWVNTDQPEKLVTRSIQWVKSHQQPSSWANMPWTLTPQINPLMDEAGRIAKDIIDHAPDVNRMLQDVRELEAVFQKVVDSAIVKLSRKVNPLLERVLNNELAAERVNSITVDFSSESKVVELAVTRSRREVAAVR